MNIDGDCQEQLANNIINNFKSENLPERLKCKLWRNFKDWQVLTLQGMQF